MKKIAYIISLVEHSALFESIAAYFRGREDVRMSFILLHYHESVFEKELRNQGDNVHRIYYRSKKDIPGAILRTRKLLKSEKIDIVHTHLFEAGFVGMSAARMAGIRYRIHTRHDAMIHHHYFPSSVKYDRLINRLATGIVAISRNVKNILHDLEHVPETKIRIIHHGFDLENFADCSDERVSRLRKQYTGREKGTVIGAISRLIEWKGLQYLIPAFAEYLSKDPQAHLIIANATGPYEQQLREQLSRIPSANWTLIRFEKDVTALYHLFDVFVHLPVNEKEEAFGQVYIEAMASARPCIFTSSGIISETGEPDKNCIIVPFRDHREVYRAICRIMEDRSFAEQLGKNARASAEKEFRSLRMMKQLDELYEECT